MTDQLVSEAKWRAADTLANGVSQGSILFRQFRGPMLESGRLGPSYQQAVGLTGGLTACSSRMLRLQRRFPLLRTTYNCQVATSDGLSCFPVTRELSSSA